VAEATQDNMAMLALNKFLRTLPHDQRGLFKDCRIAAVIPVYMPHRDLESPRPTYFAPFFANSASMTALNASGDLAPTIRVPFTMVDGTASRPASRPDLTSLST